MHASRVALLMTAHCRERAVRFRHDPIRMSDEIASCRCGARLLADAIDEAQSDAALQFTNLQAHCRLRQIELACGGRKAAEPDDSRQGAELVQIETAHQECL